MRRKKYVKKTRADRNVKYREQKQDGGEIWNLIFHKKKKHFLHASLYTMFFIYFLFYGFFISLDVDIYIYVAREVLLPSRYVCVLPMYVCIKIKKVPL